MSRDDDEYVQQRDEYVQYRIAVALAEMDIAPLPNHDWWEAEAGKWSSPDDGSTS